MGRGYWVIIADGFGVGLTLINARLLDDGTGRNWWPTDDDDDNEVIRRAWQAHNLDQYGFAKVVL